MSRFFKYHIRGHPHSRVSECVSVSVCVCDEMFGFCVECINIFRWSLGWIFWQPIWLFAVLYESIVAYYFWHHNENESFATQYRRRIRKQTVK